MARTVKQAKADIYLRDTDSQSLFNNSGELSFKYFHEWNDCYDKTTGKTAQIDGETYDESTGTYKPSCPEGCIPVFNGRLSALWDNMVSCFPDRIKSMYVTMRGNGLSYKDMLMKYKEFWRYWCENLYNADAFGYANTGNFDKAFGDKLQMMDFFFQKRQRYLDSKYCCGSSVSNHLRMRLSEVGKGFAIKYYQAIYSSLQWAVGSFATQRNIEPGTYSYMPWKMEGSPQDTTFDIDDADLITELSTYTKTSSGYAITGLEGVGNFKFDSDMGILKRLTKFIMNYTVAKPNTNELGAHFDLSGMTLLKQVIVRNVKNLTNSIVLSSDIIEEVDFTGTPIVGVSTPPSDSLAKLVLPSSVTALRLKGYTNLKPSGLRIAGYSNVDVLEVEDCPYLNSYDILKACYDAGAPLTDVTLRGVEWEGVTVDLLTYLIDHKAGRITGRMTLAAGEKVDATLKMRMVELWGDVDDETSSLYVSYEKVPITRVSLSGKAYYDKIGTYSLRLSTSPSGGNDILSVEWSMEANAFATIDSRTGVISVTRVGSKEDDDKATVTATITLSGGDTKEAQMAVRFYRYDVQLGDFLFSDGSYGHSLSDSDKTPVGVVFYLQPVERKYGLAVALNDYGSRVWGLFNSTNTNSGMGGISLDDYTGSPYDIAQLRNVDGAPYHEMSDSTYLDEGNAENDGFKAYARSLPCGDIGFVEVTDEMFDTLDLGEYLDDIGLHVGDSIATGQLNTIKIMRHRDRILQDNAVGKPVPMAHDGKTEAEDLASCITSIIADAGGKAKYQQYYYPAASYGHAYVPKVKRGEDLDESLGPHRWFLPSVGEVGRIKFYECRGTADQYAIFERAKNAGVYTNTNVTLWCSSEYSANNAWLVQGLRYDNGNYLGILKFREMPIRPIVSFKI